MVGLVGILLIMKDEERKQKMTAILALLKGTTMSKEEVAGEVGVSRKTLTNWEQNYPKFLQQVKEARETRQDLNDLVRKGIKKRIIAETDAAATVDKDGKLLNDIKTLQWHAEHQLEEYKQQEQQTAVIGAIPLTEEQLEALKTKKTI